MIELKQGDILQSGAQALVNPVNCMGVMGAGLASQFRRAFPEDFRVYRAACKAREVRAGKMFVTSGDGRHIVHFPTKVHWENPSELVWIEQGLADLVGVIHVMDIRSIAIPPLGCGLGGLKWDVVQPKIVVAMEQCPETQVLLYAPPDA